jgi:hypothetical protein
MEDDLKILKVEYLSDQTQAYMTKLYCTNPLNEDNFQ